MGAAYLFRNPYGPRNVRLSFSTSAIGTVGTCSIQIVLEAVTDYTEPMNVEDGAQRDELPRPPVNLPDHELTLLDSYTRK